MKKLFLFLAFALSSSIFAQANPSYQGRANLVTETNINKHITDLVAIGIRHSGATNIARNRQARDLIIQKFKEFGLNGYLLKPFKAKEIETVLSNVFNTSQLPSRN